MGAVLQGCLTVALCFVCYKLGQKAAWNYIAQNYIAIHKSAVIGPILIKNNGTKEKFYGKRNKKNIARRNDKKASK